MQETRRRGDTPHGHRETAHAPPASAAKGAPAPQGAAECGDLPPKRETPRPAGMPPPSASGEHACAWQRRQTRAPTADRAGPTPHQRRRVAARLARPPSKPLPARAAVDALALSMAHPAPHVFARPPPRATSSNPQGRSTNSKCHSACAGSPEPRHRHAVAKSAARAHATVQAVLARHPDAVP